MCFFICLIPMTFWLVMAYLVYFLANRSEGKQKVIGRVLGVWAIGLACCFLVLGAYIQFLGESPLQDKLAKLLGGKAPGVVYREPPPALKAAREKRTSPAAGKSW